MMLNNYPCFCEVILAWSQEASPSQPAADEPEEGPEEKLEEPPASNERITLSRPAALSKQAQKDWTMLLAVAQHISCHS